MENRLKDILKELNVSQRDLAKQLGVSTATINIFVNRGLAKIETVEKVAQALGIPPWRLLLSDKDIEDVKNLAEGKEEKPREVAVENVPRLQPNEFVCPSCNKVLSVHSRNI